ncbi:hypothetical protein JKP88DRAFT_246097 [Tribonema minus]|uniref:Uncharacterized protein n=1 Tax=Tribonema minus TaxID=303371 RepID=A0A835YYE8_9STRA|nr:hypothetical protein JKP88DRAFT_246097 [Tribonema minus]
MMWHALTLNLVMQQGKRPVVATCSQQMGHEQGLAKQRSLTFSFHNQIGNSITTGGRSTADGRNRCNQPLPANAALAIAARELFLAAMNTAAALLRLALAALPLLMSTSTASLLDCRRLHLRDIMRNSYISMSSLTSRDCALHGAAHQLSQRSWCSWRIQHPILKSQEVEVGIAARTLGQRCRQRSKKLRHSSCWRCTCFTMVPALAKAMHARTSAGSCQMPVAVLEPKGGERRRKTSAAAAAPEASARIIATLGAMSFKLKYRLFSCPAVQAASKDPAGATSVNGTPLDPCDCTAADSSGTNDGGVSKTRKKARHVEDDGRPSDFHKRLAAIEKRSGSSMSADEPGPPGTPSFAVSSEESSSPDSAAAAAPDRYHGPIVTLKFGYGSHAKYVGTDMTVDDVMAFAQQNANKGLSNIKGLPCGTCNSTFTSVRGIVNTKPKNPDDAPTEPHVRIDCHRSEVQLQKLPGPGSSGRFVPRFNPCLACPNCKEQLGDVLLAGGLPAPTAVDIEHAFFTCNCGQPLLPLISSDQASAICPTCNHKSRVKCLCTECQGELPSRHVSYGFTKKNEATAGKKRANAESRQETARQVPGVSRIRSGSLQNSLLGVPAQSFAMLPTSYQQGMGMATPLLLPVPEPVPQPPASSVGAFLGSPDPAYGGRAVAAMQRRIGLAVQPQGGGGLDTAFAAFSVRIPARAMLAENAQVLRAAAAREESLALRTVRASQENGAAAAVQNGAMPAARAAAVNDGGSATDADLAGALYAIIEARADAFPDHKKFWKQLRRALLQPEQLTGPAQLAVRIYRSAVTGGGGAIAPVDITDFTVQDTLMRDIITDVVGEDSET